MNRRKSRTLALTTLLAFCFAGGFTACSDDNGSGPEDTPASHTVIKDGVAHAAGLNDPTQNCTQCHGADLRGGTDDEPSCFACHGQQWP